VSVGFIVKKFCVCFLFWPILGDRWSKRTNRPHYFYFLLFVISGFNSEVDENCALLGCYAASTGVQKCRWRITTTRGIIAQKSAVLLHCGFWANESYKIIIFVNNKTNHMHQFPKFIQAWNSTCFGQFLCPSSGVYPPYTRHWYTSYRFVDSFRAGPGSTLVLLKTCLQTCMTYTSAECTVDKLLMMGRGTVWNM